MIRLSKLFKRKPQADELDRAPAGARRITRKPSPRNLQHPSAVDELALTEDPEQQRARHRLIGATVLVFVAVIGLPRILDNKPKPVNNDIAVNIVTSLPAPNAIQPVIESKPSASAPIAEIARDKDVPVVSPSKEVATKEVPAAAIETKPDVKPASAIVMPPATKNTALGLAAGEEVVASTPKPKASPKADDAHAKAASAGSGRFAIQIGAFASEDRAKGWTAKMKEQKIPNYTSTKTGTDGVKLFLLRAGPFANKDAAETAEKKLKAMGLTPHLVEMGGN